MCENWHSIWYDRRCIVLKKWCYNQLAWRVWELAQYLIWTRASVDGAWHRKNRTTCQCIGLGWNMTAVFGTNSCKFQSGRHLIFTHVLYVDYTLSKHIERKKMWKSMRWDVQYAWKNVRDTPDTWLGPCHRIRLRSKRRQKDEHLLIAWTPASQKRFREQAGWLVWARRRWACSAALFCAPLLPTRANQGPCPSRPCLCACRFPKSFATAWDWIRKV